MSRRMVKDDDDIQVEDEQEEDDDSEEEEQPTYKKRVKKQCEKIDKMRHKFVQNLKSFMLDMQKK